MILLDTSVWADHLRHTDAHAQQLLRRSQVAMHPMVAGELSCGYLKNRKELTLLWQCLPQAVEAGHDEVMLFIEQNKLMGKGVGFIDFHLLASCLLSGNMQLWTIDKRLLSLAQDMQIAYRH